jgi:uncharacterized delta-60 repeat protein
VLPDGKILVAGSSYEMTAGGYRILVIRLTPDGRLDRSFGGGDGLVTAGLPGLSDEAYAMTVRPDGKFVVCGSAYDDTSGDSAFELVRFKPGGAPDPSFGVRGIVEAPNPGYTSAVCEGVTGTGNGTVAVGFASKGGPSVIAAARFGANGDPDPKFNGDGFAVFSPKTNSLASGVVDLPGGEVVIAGSGYDGTDSPDIELLQLTRSGHLDPAFGGGDGVVIDDVGGVDTASALIRLPDGRLVVAGFRNPDMFVARYRAGGARDRTFGHLGVQAKPWAGPSIASSLVLMRGKLVIAGSTQVGGHDRFAVERLFG